MGLFDFFLKKHTKSNTNANSQDVIDSTHKMNTNNSICAKIEECDSPLSFSLSNVKSIDMGGLKLVPYDAYWYFSVPDATVLNLLANTDKLKEFMPGVDFSTEEKAKVLYNFFMARTFCHICPENNVCDIGYKCKYRSGEVEDFVLWLKYPHKE